MTKARITNFSKPIGFVLNVGARLRDRERPRCDPAGARERRRDVRCGHPVHRHGERAAVHRLLACPRHDEGPVRHRSCRRTGFDVWEDGESCTGGADICEANLRGGNDHYTLNAAGTLGASQLTSGELPGLVCADRRRSSRHGVLVRDDRLEHAASAREPHHEGGLASLREQRPGTRGLVHRVWWTLGTPSADQRVAAGHRWHRRASICTSASRPSARSANPSARTVHRESEQRRERRQHHAGLAHRRRPAPPYLIFA